MRILPKLGMAENKSVARMAGSKFVRHVVRYRYALTPLGIVP